MSPTLPDGFDLNPFLIIPGEPRLSLLAASANLGVDGIAKKCAASLLAKDLVTFKKRIWSPAHPEGREVSCGSDDGTPRQFA